MRIDPFMQHAIQLAETNMRAGKGGPFGAIIVKNNQIIAEGWNCVTSSNDPTAHAEIVAIRKACTVLNSFSLAGCTLYTSCEPCPMCLAAIYWAHLDRVYYAATRDDAAAIGFDDAAIYQELGKSFAQRSIPFEQMMRQQALAPFKQWQSKTDKIPY